MVVNDPIADMLTRIRNALLARHKTTDIPSSKLKVWVAEVLKAEGYIEDFHIGRGGAFDVLRLQLKYTAERESVVQGLRRVSRPGSRRYVKHTELQSVRRGLGTAIVSTSRGVMTDREARQRKLGGELLCEIW
jgi:small subunit ribosomal protein S8